LGNLNIAIGSLRALTDKEKSDTVPDQHFRDQLADTSRRINDLVCSVSEIMDPKLFAELSVRATHVRHSFDLLRAHCNSVSSAYEELVGMRLILQKGISEEKSVRFRIYTELDSLQATSSQISADLEYIQVERDKLRYKAANDFHHLPLMDLVHSSQGGENPSWARLYGKRLSIPINK
jgi:hypothetical protein